MVTLTKRIELLEQRHQSHDAVNVLLHHLGVLDVPMPSTMPVQPQSLDDVLIASLIAGAKSAMER